MKWLNLCAEPASGEGVALCGVEPAEVRALLRAHGPPAARAHEGTVDLVEAAEAHRGRELGQQKRLFIVAIESENFIAKLVSRISLQAYNYSSILIYSNSFILLMRTHYIKLN